MSTRLATTVLLLRGGRTDLEIFMVQRHRKMGFLPNAWVFPGGRVDAADRMDGHPALVGGDQVLGQLDLPRPDAIAHVVAGLRETWEEIGVWLGDGPPDPGLRHAVAARERSLVSVLGDASRLHLDALRAWSWWVTPEAEPKRYDTRFLITLAEDADGSHDEVETVDSRWVSPRQVLEEQSHEAFPMAPPTWWTLKELAAFGSAEEAYDAAKTRVQRPIQPIMSFHDTGISLQLPGHTDHPEPAIEGVPRQIVFRNGWVAED